MALTTKIDTTNDKQVELMKGLVMEQAVLDGLSSPMSTAMQASTRMDRRRFRKMEQRAHDMASIRCAAIMNALRNAGAEISES